MCVSKVCKNLKVNEEKQCSHNDKEFWIEMIDFYGT